MSEFDQFDFPENDDFFSNVTQQQTVDEDDNDLFSMFEEGARTATADEELSGVVAADTADTIPTTFGFAEETPMHHLPPVLEAPTQAALAEVSGRLGVKRGREGADTVAQDFGILHNDPSFKELFTTPKSIILATPIVVNCIGLVYLGCGVDLRALACSVRNVEYNCSRAPRAVLRLVEPHCSAIIRSNGVITIVGSGSVQATKTAAELTARIIRCALGLVDLLAIKFRLRTLMVRFDLQRPVRIGNLAADNPDCASYEPETFCACILRLTGALLSDGSSFGEPSAVANAKASAPANEPVLATNPIPQGALQAEVDDFFAVDDVFDENNGAVLGAAVVEATASTQARALSAVRWTVSANVFVSGKVTMIGAKSVDEVAAAYSKLLKLVKPHMKLI